jgi:hypothetical protein
VVHWHRFRRGRSLPVPRGHGGQPVPRRVSPHRGCAHRG